MKFQSDSNAKQIVEALRERGAIVFYWRAVSRTKGVPDLIVGYGGITYLVEVKAEKGKLSEHQEKMRATWKGGPICTVRSVEGALAAVGITQPHLEV